MASAPLPSTLPDPYVRGVAKTDFKKTLSLHLCSFNFTDKKIDEVCAYLLPTLNDHFNTLKPLDLRFSRNTPKNIAMGKKELTHVSGWMTSLEDKKVLIQIISPLPRNQKVIGKGTFKVIKKSESFIFNKDAQGNITLVSRYRSILGVIKRKNDAVTDEEKDAKNAILCAQTGIELFNKYQKILPPKVLASAITAHQTFVTSKGMIKFEIEQERYLDQNFEQMMHTEKIISGADSYLFDLPHKIDTFIYIASYSIPALEKQKIINADLQLGNFCATSEKDLAPLMIDPDCIKQAYSQLKEHTFEFSQWDTLANVYSILTPAVHVCAMAKIIGSGIMGDLFTVSFKNRDYQKVEVEYFKFVKELLQSINIFLESLSLEELKEDIGKFLKENPFSDYSASLHDLRCRIKLVLLVVEIYRKDDELKTSLFNTIPEELTDEEQNKAALKYYLENKSSLYSIRDCAEKLKEIQNFYYSI